MFITSNEINFMLVVKLIFSASDTCIKEAISNHIINEKDSTNIEWFPLNFAGSFLEAENFF